jgi:hypothetical protein
MLAGDEPPGASRGTPPLPSEHAHQMLAKEGSLTLADAPPPRKHTADARRQRPSPRWQKDTSSRVWPHASVCARLHLPEVTPPGSSSAAGPSSSGY